MAKKLSATELEWVKPHLTEGELSVWNGFNTADKRHTYGVAKRAENFSGQLDTVPDGFIAAALLHDCGKIDLQLDTMSRVIATLAGSKLPAGWREKQGYLGRLARYRMHPELGSEKLTSVGARQLVVDWAADHHKPVDKWNVDTTVGELLKKADDE